MLKYYIETENPPLLNWHEITNIIRSMYDQLHLTSNLYQLQLWY
jgi:hypothetical protein